MSPPGKKIGWMTCESVVSTSQRSPIRIAAPSSMRRQADARRAARRIGGEGVEEDVLDQPAHRAAAGAVLQHDALVGHRQKRHVGSSQVGNAAVLVPDPAGAFAADHARADRRVGHALVAEQRAVVRRRDAGHDVAADALARQRRTARRPTATATSMREAPARVDVRPLVAQPQVAVRARARCRASGRRSAGTRARAAAARRGCRRA